MKSFKTIAISSLYILAVVAMLLFLFRYDKTISSIEKDGKVIAYSTIKIKGYPPILLKYWPLIKRSLK